MTPKKPAAVVDAEKAADDKAAELGSAKEVVQRLEREHAEALDAARKAREEADAALPQCRMVRVRWRSGTDEAAGLVVILRKTPGGMLVVRRVGDRSGYEFKFKWRAFAGTYAQAERQSYASDERALRDVPAEYMPADALQGD